MELKPTNIASHRDRVVKNLRSVTSRLKQISEERRSQVIADNPLTCCRYSKNLVLMSIKNDFSAQLFPN